MNWHNIIFSETRSCRYGRHLLFWSARYLLLVLAYLSTGQLFFGGIELSSRSMARASCQLSCEILYTCCVAYYILPLFLSKKKILLPAALSIFATICVLLALSWIHSQFYPATHAADLTFLGLWSAFWGYMSYGPPAVCGVFLIIKTFKAYSKTMKEREVLIQENARAESLLLKAQVHPHFLFNTLNNIFSFTQTQPDTAVHLVDNLSATMRYMTSECSSDYVYLEQELNMIRNYIELEMVRYGDRLTTRIETTGELTDKQIAPLLLIPLVENCFKHGASQLLEKAWIKLSVFVEGSILRVELGNNKAPTSGPTTRKGIGLENVRKRLDLLYPANHQFEIVTENESFLVRLAVPLHTAPTTTPPRPPTTASTTSLLPSYG